MTFAKLYSAGEDTIKTTTMIFTLVISAEIFSNFISFAGLPDAILLWVTAMDVGPWTVMFFVILMYLVLGVVLESLLMVLLTVPIFFPLVMSLDFGTGILSDPEMVAIWFGIIVVVVTEISLIPPPIGLNVFVLKSVVSDISIRTIFRGVLPFWLADLIRLTVLLAFPYFPLLLIP